MRLNVKDSMLIVLLIVIAVLVVALIFTATTYMDGSKLIGKETNNIKGINIKFSIRDMNEEERVLELDQNEVQNFVKILQSSKFKRTGKKIDGGGGSMGSGTATDVWHCIRTIITRVIPLSAILFLIYSRQSKSRFDVL